MTITSTEFQQRPGHYLALAEKGQKIMIKRQKPRPATFRLTVDSAPKSTQDNFDDWLKKAKKCQISVPDKDAVAFQRRVRS